MVVPHHPTDGRILQEGDPTSADIPRQLDTLASVALLKSELVSEQGAG